MYRCYCSTLHITTLRWRAHCWKLAVVTSIVLPSLTSVLKSIWSVPLSLFYDIQCFGEEVCLIYNIIIYLFILELLIMVCITANSLLTAIIQSRRLTLFGHIMRMDDNADAKRILLASPPADWRRQLGCPRITWLSTIQQDLKQHHLRLPEAADLAQNRPLWRMMLTYGTT